MRSLAKSNQHFKRAISKLPLGRLPGDIVVDRENFRFYFPITTMIIISVMLSAILWLIRK